ncbi:hypothetical protein [Prevotella sp. tf2-5]|jgi:hypothetical protein|nr:hypothetical protein [Prevotella sp. tf2-5]SFO70154.1 hypothetical protein SAMN04487852_105160 [Prevotella sp. tf2-5]
MEKEKYVKPTCRAIRLTHRMQLLAGSGSYTDPEPTPPNEIPDYDDWLE